MAIETHIHDGADWRKVQSWYAHDGTAWRPLKAAYCHDGTDWRKVFGGGWYQRYNGANCYGLCVLGDYLIVSTANGTYQTNDFTTLTALGTGSPSYLNPLIADGSNVYGLSTNGQVHKWNGSSWSTLGSAAGYTQLGVSGSTIVVATWNTSQVYSWDGSSFVSLVGSTRQPYNTCCIVGGTICSWNGVVSSDRKVVSWDGSDWNKFGTLTTGLATRVSNVGGTLFFCSTSKTAHYSGGSWTEIDHLGSSVAIKSLNGQPCQIYNGALAAWDGSDWKTTLAAGAPSAMVSPNDIEHFSGRYVMSHDATGATSRGLYTWNGANP